MFTFIWRTSSKTIMEGLVHAIRLICDFTRVNLLCVFTCKIILGVAMSVLLLELTADDIC